MWTKSQKASHNKLVVALRHPNKTKKRIPSFNNSIGALFTSAWSRYPFKGRKTTPQMFDRFVLFREMKEKVHCNYLFPQCWTCLTCLSKWNVILAPLIFSQLRCWGYLRTGTSRWVQKLRETSFMLPPLSVKSWSVTCQVVNFDYPEIKH